MEKISLKDKAIMFRNLHHTGRILVIPNAWDVPSARIFEETNFHAIATTSGGVSTSLGYPDGEKISREEMLGAVSRIANSVSVPVSADMEAGYGEDLEQIEETARGVIRAGAVGLNIEDGTRNKEKPLRDIDQQIEKIKAIKKTAESLDVPLFVNARTDVFLRLAGGGGNKSDLVKECIERGTAYKRAGADCIFAIGLKDAESISKVVQSLNFPVNVVAGRGSLSIGELQSLGVARASIATGAYLALLGTLKKIALELKEKGTFEVLNSSAITHEELNRLAVPRK